VRDVLREILRTTASCAFDVPAYCFMPDHLHLLICGNQPWSYLPGCLKLLRQRAAVEFSRVRGERLWQSGYFEHVLRNDEAVETVARYIETNPVRAGLATTVGEWRFTGGSYLRPDA
jgi:putative transposase